jgi:pimeloyl-ACP methyl ester carboxylesterase
MGNAPCEAVIHEYCRELTLAAVVPIIRGYAGAPAMATDPTRICSANCSKPRSPIGIKAPRAGCCARRAFPISRRALISSRLVKNSTLKIYPGASHGLCTTHAEQVNADLLTFLKG